MRKQLRRFVRREELHQRALPGLDGLGRPLLAQSGFLHKCRVMLGESNGEKYNAVLKL